MWDLYTLAKDVFLNLIAYPYIIYLSLYIYIFPFHFYKFAQFYRKINVI